MTTATGAPPAVDLADPALYGAGDPEAVWAALRRDHPVHWNESPDGGGFWAVTRHADVQRVLKDTATFTSAQGMRIGHNPTATAEAAGKMLIVTDAPRHGKIRRVISSAFTPRTVARLEQNMRTIVREELEPVLDGEPCEFTDFAAVLPVAVICDLLGVPKSDWAFMLKSTRAAFGASEVDPIARLEAHAGMLAYYADLVDFRRDEPGDDVISAMVNGTVDGEPLTDEEIFLNCDGLISGGNETTRHATVGGLLALAADPGQWRLAAASPDRMDGVVDEILRYTSPAMHVLRTASRDTEIAGRPIRAGDPVTVWMPSANRDGTVFEAPERFDVRRTPNPHVAFGVGPHFCLGGALARTELRVLFTELLAAAGSAEPAGPARRLHSNLIWGYESAPVLLHPRAERERR
ncbi:putative cytochrome P450 126 [Kitasatospora xanthocidica]|uniref:cytochrome P450 n=1 Tax=Kitasatospora xanthocidica TaxID=83382 RepID=UPI001671EA6F|nr:cytochrome P450 [Kitasatospora xanthocidica]GHF37206.1 putative cytochrome P450 126 [Kitasatospora xanthocidica]